MKKKSIAINGFGRIGRLAFRNLMNNPTVEVKAINDLTDNATLAHLLKYDTVHGRYDGNISFDESSITVNGMKIQTFAERDPSKLPWQTLDIDVVLECTGIFRQKDKAAMHLTAGAKKVIISAPGKGDGIKTIVLGVNDHEISPNENIYSNASCTTNCLAPVMKIINDNWGIEKGSMTTIHAFTADQRIQDAPHSDLRRARAATMNIVPTSTGAAQAVGKVVPEVQGKLSAMAMRVPVVTGSVIEVNCIVKKNTTREEINAAFKAMAENGMKGVLEYTEDPIVSSDIVGNTHSSIFDANLTEVTENLIKVVSWYDNESGYSARIADLAIKI